MLQSDIISTKNLKRSIIEVRDEFFSKGGSLEF